MVLVRQSRKLCQNATYPRCHPDLNNLERDKTRRKTESSFDSGGFWGGGFPPPAPPSSFLKLLPLCGSDMRQSNLRWQREEEDGQWRRQGRGGGRNMKCSRTIARGRCPTSVWSRGSESFPLFQLLISNWIFTSFYKLQSLCCTKGCKTNRQSAGIKPLCWPWLAGLLGFLTSSATAERLTTREILALLGRKQDERWDNSGGR